MIYFFCIKGLLLVKQAIPIMHIYSKNVGNGIVFFVYFYLFLERSVQKNGG